MTGMFRRVFPAYNESPLASDTPSPIVTEAASSIIYASLQIESKGAGRSSFRSDLRAPTS